MINKSRKVAVTYGEIMRKYGFLDAPAGKVVKTKQVGMYRKCEECGKYCKEKRCGTCKMKRRKTLAKRKGNDFLFAKGK